MRKIIKEVPLSRSADPNESLIHSIKMMKDDYNLVLRKGRKGECLIWAREELIA